ncbi:Shikimate kinase [Candidatus Roizmanbacteria bacterium]|nr:Shikimate kinase [Candidatus Roizmanbacteria bacterium]
MKIILIGFMGSGKTTVGHLLAKKLSLGVIEMDELILEKSNRKSISEIFLLDGEDHFRSLETTVAKEILKIDNIVVLTGGGIVMKDRNRRFLKNGTVIFLKTSFEILKIRLKDDITRPLFKDKIKAKKLFDLRQNIYERWANHIILTDKKSINQVVSKLLKCL